MGKYDLTFRLLNKTSLTHMLEMFRPSCCPTIPNLLVIHFQALRYHVWFHLITMHGGQFSSTLISIRAMNGVGGSYCHFSAQISTKSQCPRAQIPSSQWVSCLNYNPIFFFADESQSQGIRSFFPSRKISKTQFPFYHLRTYFRLPIISSNCLLIDLFIYCR